MWHLYLFVQLIIPKYGIYIDLFTWLSLNSSIIDYGYSVLHFVAIVVQCVAVCCSVLQCVVVCCSVL